MPSIPDWILRHSTSRFAELARAHLVWAWAVLALELLALLFLVKYVWHMARGYQLPRQIPKKPDIATRGRAIDGLLWLPAVVLATWVPGYRGIIALLGDTIFIAFASLITLEWYVWWQFPKSVGKAVELLVLAVYYWLAWRIAQVVPAKLAWYVLVASIATSVIWFVDGRLTGLLRLIVLRNVLPPFVISALFLPMYVPSSMVPAIPTWLLCFSLGLLFSWSAVSFGAMWLKLPDEVARRVAPVWITLQFILGMLGAPGFRE